MKAISLKRGSLLFKHRRQESKVETTQKLGDFAPWREV